MADEIKIWAIDGSSMVTAVESRNQTETERMLEDTLVRNPDMLMTGLSLVGRQTPAAAGALDLLGVDEDGRLVVFELKKGTLTRDAVSQVIDYCSFLESLDVDELKELITANSGKNGVDKIKDFEEWYGERTSGKPLDTLTPIRMALVGLGVDDQAARMVSYLHKKGVDISLLSFHGYEYEGALLLARQVERRDRRERPHQPTRSIIERLNDLDELADGRGVGDIWKDVIQTLTPRSGRPYPTPYSEGITFYMPPIALPELVKLKSAGGSHSVRLDGSRGVRITFYPTAVHLCLEQFKVESETIPFEYETPPNAAVTTQVDKQWFCLLDAPRWDTHKDALTRLAKAVNDSWIVMLSGKA